jgi:hypothetical protein
VITEDYSIGALPVERSAFAAPPQEAKKLARALVSSSRVVVYATEERAVVRVLYIGDRTLDGDDIPSLSELSCTWMVSSVNSGGLCLTEILTDEKKTRAASFYRSAVKWSVLRSHHVGMPQNDG